MLVSTLLQVVVAQKAAQTFTLQFNTQLLSQQERHSVLNAGVWLAIDEINADPSLPNVRVNTTNYYTWDGVASQVRLSVNAFMQSVANNVPGNVIIGPPFSSQAIPMSANAEAFDIPVVSYLATAPSLSDKSRYPYFSRILTSDASIGTGFANYFVSKNFKRVGAIVENSEYGIGLQEAFVKEASRLGLAIDFIVKIDTPESITNALEQFKSSAARVIVAMGGSDLMAQMSIAAYDKNYMGPKSGYLWALTSDVLIADSKALNRNISEILCGNVYLNERIGDFPADINPLMNAMNESLIRHENRGFTKASWDVRTTQFFTYGAIKASAYATQLMINDVGRNMTNFTFTGAAFNTKFRSIVDLPLFGTQKLTINENGDALSFGFEVGNFRINPTGGTPDFKVVETYGPIPGDSKRKMRLEKTHEAIIYPDGTSKNSFEPPTISLADLPGAKFAVYAIVGLLCLLFLSSMVFIIRNSHIVILKVTSWYINSFILLSLCFIVCSTIPTFLAPTVITCTSRILIFSFGFTLIGCLLFLKNYRVWRIFCSKTLAQRYVLPDCHILMISLGVVAIDLAFVTLWMVVLKPGPKMTYTGVAFNHFCDAAESVNMNPLAWVICMAVKVPVIMVGAAISVMNRNIIDQKFNESIVTGSAIYNISLIGLFTVILSNGVITQPLTAQIVQASAILFCSLTTYIIYFGKTMNYSVSEVVFKVLKYDKAIITGSSGNNSRIKSGQSFQVSSSLKSPL